MFKKVRRQDDIRASNRQEILRLLRNYPELTRHQIVSETGLSVPSVSAILSGLEEQNWIKETEELVPTGGRRAVAFSLNADFHKVLAVHVGMHQFSIATIDMTGQVLEQKTIKHNAGASGRFVSALKKALHSELEQMEKRGISLCGVGVSFPGVVDENKRITLAPNIGGEGLDLSDLISDVSDQPIYIDNDARLGVLAECWWKALVPSPAVAFLMVDYGVGVGLAFNGAVHAGKNFAAGDIGHAVIDPSGRRCECGQFGCLETFVSYKALVRKITEDVHLGRPSLLLPENTGEPAIESLDCIINAALAGDDVAQEAIKEVGRYLAIAVSMLNVIVAPDQVYIGGTLSKVYELMLPSLGEMLSGRGPELHRQGLTIKPATYRENTSLMGAAALVYQNVFAGNCAEQQQARG